MEPAEIKILISTTTLDKMQEGKNLLSLDIQVLQSALIYHVAHRFLYIPSIARMLA